MTGTITPQYTRVEYVRTFFVRTPIRLEAANAAIIDDRHLTGTRARLRKLTRSVGDAECTLCREQDGARFTSVAVAPLSAIDYAAFAHFEANIIRKRRHTVTPAERPVFVDVFEGALTGLVLCEVTAATEAEVEAVVPPPWASEEVTGDPFFDGARLAFTTPEQLRVRLAHS